MTDYYTLVKENASERSELTKRQDEDVLLRDLDAYVMKDLAGKQLSGVVHVTLNRPKVIAEYIKSALGNTSEQIVVQTEEKSLDTDYIEDFRRLSFDATNARLLRQNLWELNSYFDEQACIRGGASARCLFQMVDGVLVPNISLWDYRYVNYEMGAEGLSWASYGFGTKRKKAAIESEQWWQQGKPTISGKEAEVVDVWHTEGNEVFLDSKKVFEQAHAYGFTPVVIRTVPLGSMLSDKGDIKNQSESVFFLIRTVIPELYRLISIIQTHNLLTIKRPIQTAFREGGPAHEAPDYAEITAPGASSSADIGGGTKPVDLGAVTNAAVIALSIIDRALEEGGFSLDMFRSPLGSGVAILQAKEGRDVIFLPRLKNKALMKQGLGAMFTQQVIQIGGTVEVGLPGHKRAFQTKK
ncbi:MAG: hypothetical protein Q8M94_02715, partial [Ignavibacteria bacterium]|nr:hypothetical protein [Ignavibacteria bacterium]